ncbi:MAG: VOC family protein [Flavobacteriales bacterium]
MASTSTWLHFRGNAEEAFNFYKSVFGGDFVNGITRYSSLTPENGYPPIAEADKNLVIQVALPILGGHIIKGNDAPEFLGELIKGNNMDINLQPDTRKETERLFKALSAGGKVEMELHEMGDYFGACVDKFGVQWMLQCTAKE